MSRTVELIFRTEMSTKEISNTLEVFTKELGHKEWDSATWIVKGGK